VRVAVLTTSYPRWEGDAAGSFVASSVDAVRSAGVEVEVVSPAGFRHFGVAYGDGVAGNLRSAPWRLGLVPAFLASYARAARRGARGADLVHAHWLPSALVARTTGLPTVLQLWGTDVALARKAPRVFGPVLRGAAVVVCPSTALADAARELGAGDVRLIPSPVRVPDDVGVPDEPPHVLFLGRLSPEKGALQFADATAGLPRVVVGDGPLRHRLPDALGLVPTSRVPRYLERAAVVCVPSLREGYGFACAEALAAGRPVVASAVGGLLDHVEDGVNGLLVPPGDVAALRAAIERLLGDAKLRAKLGAAAHARARERLAPEAAAAATVRAYDDALATS
jgi:glycosyltransferase involved in cell wall biosynthesis